MKKIMAAFMAFAACMTILTGCGQNAKGGKTQEQTAQEQAAAARKTQEIRQNDYRGGLTRMQALQANVLSVMENMKLNNKIIREDNPNSFWTANGYQDFVATFLDTPIIADTIWFNEEEGDWQTTLSMMASVKNSFTEKTDGGYKLKATVKRNEKDDYTVSNVPCEFWIDAGGKKTYSGKATYRVLYDCDKDWCKSYAIMSIDKSLPDVTTQMIEYMRVDDNTFAVQTNRERLVIILKPAESDTDIRQREIKEFYYSKLVQEGMRTTFEPYEALPEYDEAQDLVLKSNAKHNEFMANFAGINEDGEIAILYGQSDSMFYRSPQEMNAEKFVFEDKSLQQAICYKDGVLVVTTYNKLSGQYERFTYALKDANNENKVSGELEKLVEINNLVGIQELPEIETDEPVPTEDELNAKKQEKKEETPAETTAPAKNEPQDTQADTSDTIKTEQVTETTAAE